MEVTCRRLNGATWPTTGFRLTITAAIATGSCSHSNVLNSTVAVVPSPYVTLSGPGSSVTVCPTAATRTFTYTFATTPANLALATVGVASTGAACSVTPSANGMFLKSSSCRHVTHPLNQPHLRLAVLMHVFCISFVRYTPLTAAGRHHCSSYHRHHHSCCYATVQPGATLTVTCTRPATGLWGKFGLTLTAASAASAGLTCGPARGSSYTQVNAVQAVTLNITSATTASVCPGSANAVFTYALSGPSGAAFDITTRLSASLACTTTSTTVGE